MRTKTPTNTLHFPLNSDSNLAGYSIPATTHILPNLYAINMDSELWENPENFNPERFLKDGKVHKPDYVIPFSVGKKFLKKISIPSTN